MLRGLVLLAVLAGCDVPFGINRFDRPDASQIDGAPDAYSSSYAAAVLADHPIAYFRLDEPLGVIAHDQVATGPSGQLIANVTLMQPGAIAGDPDTAMAFDGANSTISGGNTLGFAGTATFSIECWIKPAAFDGKFHNVLSKWTPPPADYGWDLWYQDDFLTFSREQHDIPEADLASYTGLVASVYTHLVGTYDGSLMRLYVNGVEEAMATSVIVLSDMSVPFMISAGNGDATLAPMAGSIDEVAIYDAALAPDRVFAHYHLGTTPP